MAPINLQAGLFKTFPFIATFSVLPYAVTSRMLVASPRAVPYCYMLLFCEKYLMYFGRLILKGRPLLKLFIFVLAFVLLNDDQTSERNM